MRRWLLAVMLAAGCVSVASAQDAPCHPKCEAEAGHQGYPAQPEKAAEDRRREDNARDERRRLERQDERRLQERREEARREYQRDRSRGR